ncbi:MAG: 50S ribosomal protein L11 methyltransferase [Reichenbachiella sp.]
MSFIKISFKTSPDFVEIFTAELAEIGFDTFEETEEGFHSYIPKEIFSEPKLEEVFRRYEQIAPVQYSTEEIQKQNWNKDWEKNYDPIEVEGKCRVRATFHDPDPSFDYEIVIIPKMSFGTGHHATTYNMLRLEMDHDFKNKSVLDVGTGTGVLMIMASKLGARHIEGTDVDDWCIDNSTENLALNNQYAVAVHLGVINEITLQKKAYDVLLANINKNVLLSEIVHYAELLEENGTMFLSGFYDKDIVDIENEVSKHNLSIDKSVIKNDWAALKIVKY